MEDLDALIADLISEDESRADAAACKLAQFGEAASLKIEPLLRSSNADHRWWAVRTLAQMSDPSENWLILALDDGSAEVREAAALALMAHPSEVAIPGLIRGLIEPDGMLSMLAIKALTKVGKPALPALLEAYQTAGSKARIQIMRTLAEIRDHRAISVMLKATEDDSSLLNFWANEGLERLGLNMVYIKPE